MEFQFFPTTKHDTRRKRNKTPQFCHFVSLLPDQEDTQFLLPIVHHSFLMTDLRGRFISLRLPIVLVVVIVQLLFAVPSDAFVPVSRCKSLPKQSSSLSMGLYDKPLPPRPAPRDKPESNKNNNINDDDDDDDDDDNNDDTIMGLPDQSPKLFRMLPSGKEANQLLPELSRYLTSGIGCYYEETDRIVVALAENANCHPQDAAWALEACQGDPTEAWTRISMARRLGFMIQNQLPEETSDVDWDAELFSLLTTDQTEIIRPLGKDGIQERKNEIANENTKRATKDMFQTGKPDDSWMPGAKPGPVDDEPWFTG